MKAYILMLCNLMFIGCMPTINQNPLSGKLKTLEIIQESSGRSITMQYIYNNSGSLVAFQRDSLQFIIGDRSGNILDVSVTDINADPLFSGKGIYKVHLDANNKILAINAFDTLTFAESPYIRMVYDGNDLDSILVKGSTEFVHDVTGYAYQYDGSNYIKQKADWYMNMPFLGDELYQDSLNYIYTSVSNNNFIPRQIPYISVPFAFGSTDNEFLLYLLDMKGYTVFKKNMNLIQSVVSANYGYINTYSYVFNSINQVVEMHVSNPDGTGVSIKYKMTYY